jgi:hypothetical protein
MTNNKNNVVAQDSLYCAPVNNAGLRPIQGFHIKAFVLNACDGKVAWYGEFQSLTVSIRNSTESYLELGNRFPMHLDGEIQIAWVAESGMTDAAFVYRTFGVKSLRRDSGINSGPRFQISWVVNARELETSNIKEFNAGGRDENDVGGDGFNSYLAGRYRAGIAERSDQYSGSQYRPQAVGRYDLQLCKVDSVSMGAMAGRRVVALRWEGVAEGITWVDNKDNRFGGAEGSVLSTNTVFQSAQVPAPITPPPSAFTGFSGVV